jgi:hypothetical protein
LFVTAQSSVGGLAVDATYLYWTDASGAVRRLALAKGPVETLATGLANPADIAVDATGIYWINRGVLEACAAPSSYGAYKSGSVMHLSQASLDAASAALGDAGTNDATTADANPTTSFAPDTLASDLWNVSSLVRQGGATYFTDWPPSCNYVIFDGNVDRVRDGGSLEQLAIDLASPSQLFVDDTTIYFTAVADSNSGNIAVHTIAK